MAKDSEPSSAFSAIASGRDAGHPSFRRVTSIAVSNWLTSFFRRSRFSESEMVVDMGSLSAPRRNAGARGPTLPGACRCQRRGATHFQDVRGFTRVTASRRSSHAGSNCLPRRPVALRSWWRHVACSMELHAKELPEFSDGVSLPVGSLRGRCGEHERGPGRRERVADAQSRATTRAGATPCARHSANGRSWDAAADSTAALAGSAPAATARTAAD